MRMIAPRRDLRIMRALISWGLESLHRHIACRRLRAKIATLMPAASYGRAADVGIGSMQRVLYDK